MGKVTHKVSQRETKEAFVVWAQAQGVDKDNLIKADFASYLEETYPGLTSFEVSRGATIEPYYIITVEIGESEEK
jgi:hypothetical protein